MQPIMRSLTTPYSGGALLLMEPRKPPSLRRCCLMSVLRTSKYRDDWSVTGEQVSGV